MNGIRASHSEWCKLDRQISYDIAYLKKENKWIYETEIDLQI